MKAAPNTFPFVEGIRRLKFGRLKCCDGLPVACVQCGNVASAAILGCGPKKLTMALRLKLRCLGMTISCECWTGGLGSNRAERFDFSLWKFPKVFLSSLVPDGARWCQMVPDGARWCQMVPDGARCASEVFGHGHDGHDELDLEDPTPSLETQSQTYRWERGILGDIWKWWDTFNILHKILHKILHNIILYKALNNIKLNRRSLVWTTTIVNHLNIADEPWARKNRATSAPKDPKGKNEVATYYSLDSYDSYIYIIFPWCLGSLGHFVVSCQVRSGPSRDCGAGRLHGSMAFTCPPWDDDVKSLKRALEFQPQAAPVSLSKMQKAALRDWCSMSTWLERQGREPQDDVIICNKI